MPEALDPPSMAFRPASSRADSIQSSLRRAKLRPTRARMMVLGAFHHAPTHLQSRGDIVARIIAGANPVNVSTIYGAILELERRGFLSKTWTHDGKSLYWLSSAKVVNTQLECSCCHRTWPLDDEGVTAALTHASKAHGVALSTQPTRIQVICADCGDASGDRSPLS